MRKLLILLVFLFAPVAANAQSTDIQHYQPAFLYEGAYFTVDVTSLQILKNQNRVFWLLSVKDNVGILSSMEVNCKIGRSRTRAIILVTNGQATRLNKVTPWLNNTLMQKVTYFGCN